MLRKDEIAFFKVNILFFTKTDEINANSIWIMSADFSAFLNEVIFTSHIPNKKNLKRRICRSWITISISIYVCSWCKYPSHITIKYLFRGFILGVLTHTTTWEQRWRWWNFNIVRRTHSRTMDSARSNMQGIIMSFSF